MTGRQAPKVEAVRRQQGRADVLKLDKPGLAMANLAAAYHAQASRLRHVAGRLKIMGPTG